MNTRPLSVIASALALELNSPDVRAEIGAREAYQYGAYSPDTRTEIDANEVYPDDAYIVSLCYKSTSISSPEQTNLWYLHSIRIQILKTDHELTYILS